MADTGDVGVWHETYQVPASGIEAVYNGMPLFGLAKATAHIPVGARNITAKQRMAQVPQRKIP
ncbi:monooxygenase family protein [Arthrobacter sp. CAN_A1]|uniref:monooxygenase family protein n=1 Tax=Arthrobacter sp. CAN_A1 TaxID=2787717 RepID=UPI001A2B9337